LYECGQHFQEIKIYTCQFHKDSGAETYGFF